MKRHGYLWEQIVSFPNLLLAARKAQRGKRFRPDVLEFNYSLESNLEHLISELNDRTYQPGHYRIFQIFDPKCRLISAAPYRDRVVHHALCNVIQPIFENTFTRNSYANRIGFDTHRCLQEFVRLMRTYRYVLQCDIKKYFPSIDHDILKVIVRRKIKCPGTLWLIDLIIDNSNRQIPVVDHFPGDDLLTPLGRKRGLPIGNLTSQFFANVYLNGLDHFVKENLAIGGYVRYVDDFAVFSNDRGVLTVARPAIQTALDRLRLGLHRGKTQLFETQTGANFLGFRVLPEQIRVRSENLRRGRRRLKRLQTQYAAGHLTLRQVVQSLQSWEAHLQQGDTWRLRQQIFTHLVLSRG